MLNFQITKSPFTTRKPRNALRENVSRMPNDRMPSAANSASFPRALRLPPGEEQQRVRGDKCAAKFVGVRADLQKERARACRAERLQPDPRGRNEAEHHECEKARANPERHDERLRRGALANAAATSTAATTISIGFTSESRR